MPTINSLPLKDAKPTDRPHFLVWDTPNEADLQQIVFYNNAQRVNYRDNLLNRTNPQESFLVLHQQIDRELNAVRSICSECNSPVVILEELDCLMTYLSIYGQKELFWHKLLNLRQLASLLWILLPTELILYNIPQKRQLRVEDFPKFALNSSEATEVR
jgi:hypothetical protein